jgi:hypothetical protein
MMLPSCFSFAKLQQSKARLGEASTEQGSPSRSFSGARLAFAKLQRNKARLREASAEQGSPSRSFSGARYLFQCDKMAF